MNIAQLSEQLKDVPQNRLIDYARNPNSVVPQFLALAEIQRRQHLENTPQPPAATVAEDVLAQAAPRIPQQLPPQLAPQMAPQQMAQQLPENQPGVAQLPTGMPQGMASGGIVAFAGGDLVDDEQDDEDQYNAEQRQTKRDESMMMSLIAGLRSRAGEAMSAVPRAVAAIPKAVQEIKAALPESYESAKAKTESGISALQKKGSHPYEHIALDEAKKVNLDENLVRHVLNKETGGLKDPATAVSKAGARGPMQLMPGTARDLGVDINDPEQNTRGGVRYLAQMMDKFKDPTLALAAYNAGPGRVQQMLKRGLGIESLKPETQQYVKYSQGGIAHFYDGGPAERQAAALSALETNMPADYEDYASDFPLSMSDYYRQKELARAAIKSNIPVPTTVSPEAARVRGIAFGAPPIIPSEKKVDSTKINPLEMTPAEKQRYSTITEINKNLPQNKVEPFVPMGDVDIGFGPNKFAPDRDLEQAGPPRISYEDQILARNAEERLALKAQAEQDKYLALLQAGLGMMGSTSPYAMANIGQGGMQGVAAYAAAKKQRAAEARSLGVEEREVIRAKQIDEYRKEALAQEALYKKAGLSQKEIEAAEKKIQSARDDYRQYKEEFQKDLLKRYPKIAMGIPDPKYDQEMAAFLNSPEMLGLKKLAFPNLSIAPSASSASGTRPPLSSFNK